jgi:hypothetical protein
MTDIDKDWCLNMAALEGDAEIGAGSMSEYGTCPAFGYECEYVAKVEAQAMEIERLGSVIDATALHWLALQDKHPIQWEGAIDGAMAAACAEIERLRGALTNICWTTVAPKAHKIAHAALEGKAEQ